MKTVHVFSLGNLQSMAAPPPETLAVFASQQAAQLVDTDDVRASLAAIRDGAEGAALSCGPDLASAAEPLGFEVKPWSEAARAERAALALLLSAGMPFLAISDRASIAGLIRAGARLSRCQKDRDRFWRIRASLQGTDARGKLSAAFSVIAATSPDPEKVNVTLFGSAQDADAYVHSVSTPPGRAAAIGHLTLDLTPAYTHGLHTALELFTGQHHAPAVAATDGARDRDITDLEAMMLAAVSFGVAELAERPDQSEVRTVFAERDVTLVVTLAASGSDPGAGSYRGSLGWWT